MASIFPQIAKATLIKVLKSTSKLPHCSISSNFCHKYYKNLPCINVSKVKKLFDDHDCCISIATDHGTNFLNISNHLHFVCRIIFSPKLPKNKSFFKGFSKNALWKSVTGAKILGWLQLSYTCLYSTESTFLEFFKLCGLHMRKREHKSNQKLTENEDKQK